MKLREIAKDLPDEPVDGYTLRFWQLNMSEHWVYIKEKVATYYVNTSWGEYSPGNDRRGAPLVDDWMVCEDGRGVGRISCWKGVLTGDADDCFPTEKAARLDALRRLGRYIELVSERLEGLTALKQQTAAPLGGRIGGKQ